MTHNANILSLNYKQIMELIRLLLHIYRHVVLNIYIYEQFFINEIIIYIF